MKIQFEIIEQITAVMIDWFNISRAWIYMQVVYDFGVFGQKIQAPKWKYSCILQILLQNELYVHGYY